MKHGNGGDNLLSNENIPTLIEVLDKFQGSVLFDIDVKNKLDRKFLLSLIHEHDFHHYVDIKKPLETLGDAKKYIKEENKSNVINMIVLNLTNQSLDEIYQIVDLTNPQIVEINFCDISIFEQVNDFCLKKDCAVWVNTLNDVPNGGFNDKLALNSPDECWGYFINKGVSLIQTDYPLVLREWYDSSL